MTANFFVSFEELDQQDFILVRQEEEQLVAWQAPRGINVDNPATHWSINPEQAHVYKGVDAALSARRRMINKGDEHFKDVYPMSMRSFRDRNEQLEFGSLSELLRYHPKALNVVYLEFDGKTTWFANSDTLDRFLDRNKPNKYRIYHLRLS